MNTRLRFLAVPWKNDLLERFLRYVVIDTTSDRNIAETPTSAGQWELARLLVEELKALGIANVQLTEHCYVIARIPASQGAVHLPSLALMAHLDTASDVCGKAVLPQVHENWDGTALKLKNNIQLSPADFPELNNYIGDTIITSDGQTLLGADDKAGIAVIMTALSCILKEGLPHPPLEIIFTPDEETGKGLPEFPQSQIKATSCYTLDGGGLGEIEDECFNAWKSDITFFGAPIHIGYARGKLANAVAMAASFVSMLPRSESPEATDGRYGYYCPMEITGNLEQAKLEVFLRDFDKSGMEQRLKNLEQFARTVEFQFPRGSVRVESELQYINMKTKMDANPQVVSALEEAVKGLDIPLVRRPIRGGTDGSRLTELGIPTPNIFAGGHNFHSLQEWASLSEMCASVQVVLALLKERSVSDPG